MIKRPLNPMFSAAVLEGIKTTTIRDKAWPIGKTIMLYNWSDEAYRSRQVDVAVVIVTKVLPIEIHHRSDGGMFYACDFSGARLLHETEGFGSRAEMDVWFRQAIKPGRTVTKKLMRFRLANTNLNCDASASIPKTGSGNGE